MKNQIFLVQFSAFFKKMGVVLLKLALIFLVVGQEVGPSEVVGKTRTADEYWADTQLTERELELFLSPESCASSVASFLGCVNAISSIAEKAKMILMTDGTLAPMSQDLIESRLTEKKELKIWENKYLNQSEVSLDFDFLDLWKELRDKHLRTSVHSAAIASGINAFLSVTKDPHTYIVPLAMYEEVISRSDSKPMHLGFVSKRVKGGAFVRKVFEQSPAALSGLRKGDQILEVNGVSVSSLHPLQYNEMLRSQGALRLRLRVARNEGGKSETKYFEIMRGDKPYPNVVSRMLPTAQSVGLVTIHKFAKDTCEQARTQLQGMIEEGIRGLILDLRDNPGGQVDEAACLLGLFVEKGRDLFQTRYLDEQRPSDYYRSHKAPIYRGPISVLINGGSASAAEIVAGVLKDLGLATLVGERSFGKGSFQDGRLWAANPKIAFFETEGFYYFPSGWTPQLVGLDPDVEVTSKEGESFREEDLYYSAIRPRDFLGLPSGIAAWLTNEKTNCESGLIPLTESDPQIEKAFSVMSCSERGSRL